jgi:hypothetical protein
MPLTLTKPDQPPPVTEGDSTGECARVCAPGNVRTFAAKFARSTRRAGASRGHVARAGTRETAHTAAHITQRGRDALDAVTGMAVVTAQPASLAAVAQQARTGLDIDRGQHPALARAAQVYGYAVAVPVTAACYAAAWIAQRPARLVLALAVVLIVWLT